MSAIASGVAMVVLALAITVFGCESRRTTTETAEQSRYRAAARARLDGLQRTIDSLEARIDAGWESRWRDLTAERDSAEGALGRLGRAAGASWETAQAGTDRALARLERSVAAARARLRSRADSTSP